MSRFRHLCSEFSCGRCIPVGATPSGRALHLHGLHGGGWMGGFRTEALESQVGCSRARGRGGVTVCQDLLLPLSPSVSETPPDDAAHPLGHWLMCAPRPCCSMGPAAQLAETFSRHGNRRGCRTVAGVGGRGGGRRALCYSLEFQLCLALCELLPSLSLGFLCSGDESST